MSLLEKLGQPECWERFYDYRTSRICSEQTKSELRQFIDRRDYAPVYEAIVRGERFPLAEKKVISKLESEKKRTVYTYPYAENTVLKLLTYLLLRRYDGLFGKGLYSFRPNRTAKDAVHRLTGISGIGEMYSYKADISNYFNSVPLGFFLPVLEEAVGEDMELYAFLSRLLTEPEVIFRGERISEEKGIMAGTPLSAFYANLYLRKLDLHFEEMGIPYARYSDDIILFAPDAAEAESCAEYVRGFLEEQGLSLNSDKEHFGAPEEGWVFLGFSYNTGTVDIAPTSVIKLKNKMRRKCRALERWSSRSGIDGEKAAAAFIRIFNRKLFDNDDDSDLTWSRWFFPVINTADSLRVIDRYAQDCVRYLISGKRTKSRFNVRYEDIKRLGLKDLVHEYYLVRENSK